MTAYYNEHDIYAAQWLRNLIEAGHIAPGIVDERSIEDVHPNDLAGFTQCHFFAGVGVWSHSLRAAGWSDDRPVWTGSCPCQPFSAAGKGSGFDDQRHLWPAFHHLIQECRPPIVIGEQVASKDADPWVNLVQLDVEALGYGFGAVPFPSAGVGAPHIRDGLYWVAHSAGAGSQGGRPVGGARPGREGGTTERGGQDGGLADMHSDGCHQAGQRVTQAGCDGSAGDCAACEFCGYEFDIGRLGRYGCPNCEGDGLDGMADAIMQQRQDGQPGVGHAHDEAGREQGAAATAGFCGDRGLADAGSQRRQQDAGGAPSHEKAHGAAGRNEQQSNGDHLSASDVQVYRDGATSPTNGFWSDADWLLCRDGKWRPVEPGTFPLVDGAAGGMGRVRADWRTPAGKEGFGHRAGRLKGYGNAINAEAARIFIECVMEVRA